METKRRGHFITKPSFPLVLLRLSCFGDCLSGMMKNTVKVDWTIGQLDLGMKSER